MGGTAAPLAIIQHTYGTSPQDAQSRMNLKTMAGQQQIQKQLIAENDLKLQAQQEDQQDQKTIQDAFQSSIGPDGQVDYDKVRATVAPKVRLRNLQGLEDTHNKLLQGTIQMDRAKREQLLAKNTTIGNELMGLLQTPQEQRQAAYAATRARLIQLGDIDPNDPSYPEQGAPLDDQSIKGHLAQVGYAASVQKLANDQAQEEIRKAQASRATAQAAKADAETEAKTIQQGVEDAARDHLAVTDQSEHDAWLKTLDPKIAARMPKKFDPEKTPEIVQNMALTAAQRATNADKKIKADSEARKALVAGGKPGLAFLAHDPTVDKATNDAAAAALKDVEASDKKNGGLTPNEQLVQRDKELTRLSSERNRFETVRDAEVKLWTKAQKLDFAIQKAQSGLDPKVDPTSITLKDPSTGREITLAAAIAENDSTKAAAQEKTAAGKLILQQNKWGEFAPGAQQATQPAPQPAPQPGAPPPVVQQTAPPQGAPPAQVAPPRPTSIPATARARYSPSKKQWQYSTDGGTKWQPAPAQ